MCRYEYINLPTRNAVSFEPTTNTSHFHRIICHPLVNVYDPQLTSITRYPAAYRV